MDLICSEMRIKSRTTSFIKAIATGHPQCFLIKETESLLSTVVPAIHILDAIRMQPT